MREPVPSFVTANAARVLALFGVPEGFFRIGPSEECRPTPRLDVARQSGDEAVHIEQTQMCKVASSRSSRRRRRRRSKGGTNISLQVESPDQTTHPAAPMRLFRTMSLFAGAGGLDIGRANIDNCGAFHTQSAIDSCASACATFRQHHPKTAMACSTWTWMRCCSGGQLCAMCFLSRGSDASMLLLSCVRHASRSLHWCKCGWDWNVQVVRRPP